MIWWEFVWRVLILAGFLIAAAWIAGPRSVAQTRLFDFLFVAALASMAGKAAIDLSILLPGALISIAILTVVYWGVNRFALRSRAVRSVLAWRPLTLVNEGRIDVTAMRRASIDLDTLLSQLRQQGIFNIDEVDTVVLEPSGELSVLPHGEGDRMTRPVVIDGAINGRELRSTGRDRDWLTSELARRGMNLKDIFLAAYSRKGELFVAQKEQVTPDTSSGDDESDDDGGDTGMEQPL